MNIQLNNPSEKILLVDDNIDGQNLVREILSSYQVDVAGSITEAQDLLHKHKYSLVLLDVELPDGNGFDFLNQPGNRQLIGSTTIYYLTARVLSQEKVIGFSLGADDYITKPIDPDVFQARIDAFFRKKKHNLSQGESWQIGNIILDLANQSASLLDDQGKKQPLHLTTHEFRILVYLGKHQNETIKREDLLEYIWGKDINVTDRTIDSHLSNLRRKLKHSTMVVQSVYGIGYRFYAKASQKMKKSS